MRKTTYAVITLILAVTAANAQDAGVLSLEQAVGIALAHNKSLANATLQVEKAANDLASAKTHRLPQFQVEAQASQLLQPVHLTFPRGAFGTFDGIGPVPAIRKVLKLAGLTLDQIDLIELNEAFAAQVLACLRELPLDPERLNVNGGAIALGHPLGCTGAKLTASLLYEMRRRQSRYGMVTMCVGGGMGAAGVFERV